jgi:hypothetical protein
MSPSKADRIARLTVRRHASNQDADAADLEYWSQIDPAERVLQAWRLSLELWTLRDGRGHEPGLCRSVARVRRG